MKKTEISMKQTIYRLGILGLILVINACAPAKGDRPGSEYMQDMGHSIAYEGYSFNEFYHNRWNPEQYYQLSTPRLPVPGTIARGSVGLSKYASSTIPQDYTDALAIETINGSVPYYYNDNEAERTRAMQEIINNPYPITKANLDAGKTLYNVYCGICHGEKGDGSGYLVRDGGKYPAQPPSLISDEFISASNGRYYHAIMYGKNMMGSYADRLSYSERWKVIQYIRSLQATSKGKVYSETENTFNTTDMIASVAGKRNIPDVQTQPTDSTVITRIHVGKTIDSTKIIQKK